MSEQLIVLELAQAYRRSLTCGLFTRRENALCERDRSSASASAVLTVRAHLLFELHLTVLSLLQAFCQDSFLRGPFLCVKLLQVDGDLPRLLVDDLFRSQLEAKARRRARLSAGAERGIVRRIGIALTFL